MEELKITKKEQIEINALRRKLTYDYFTAVIINDYRMCNAPVPSEDVVSYIVEKALDFCSARYLEPLILYTHKIQDKKNRRFEPVKPIELKLYNNLIDEVEERIESSSSFSIMKKVDYVGKCESYKALAKIFNKYRCEIGYYPNVESIEGDFVTPKTRRVGIKREQQASITFDTESDDVTPASVGFTNKINEISKDLSNNFKLR